MPAKKAAPTKAPAKKATESKPQARSQDSTKLGFNAEATTFPSDPDLEALEAERAELQSPGVVSHDPDKQIDNDPGYDVDQLTHMAEYWGLQEPTAEVADTEAEAAEV
jgi:hypothetical protein